jgi:aminopeptidase-like protein
MAHVLRHLAPSARIVEFSPYGYDERQFCSPGFNLPVGLLQRSQFATFPEYHTSADNLDFIQPEHLELSCQILLAVIDIFERDGSFLNLNPKCEPQLGRRGLYAAAGGHKDAPEQQMAMLWVLNLSDGGHSLLDIAERASLPFTKIRAAADLLLAHGLLGKADRDQAAST